MTVLQTIERLLDTSSFERGHLERELSIHFERENELTRWHARGSGAFKMVELIDAPLTRRVILYASPEGALPAGELFARYDPVNAEIFQIIPQVQIVTYRYRLRGQELYLSFSEQTGKRLSVVAIERVAASC